ncbi:HAMP domain-containing protein (plasmid) [Rhizobium sp. WYJ-E13]|nr:HAMP domain-containing protein [Rhizobium sp. WYJ-E13]
MIRRPALSRQILLSMAVVTMIAVLVVFFGVYVIYAILISLFPYLLDEDSWLPSGTDLLILTGLAFPALLVAGFVSLKLAARILVPINSLAESARRIADGDLTARATPGDHSLGETAHLVADFNIMAQKLQDMADNVAFWNAAIAHELRTPLTILKGRLQGVADGLFPVDEKLIDGLMVQTEGLTRLVNDLRVVTLADAGRLDLQIELIDLAAEIRKVADVVAPSLQQAGFSLELALVDMTVPADAVRLRQVLLALLNNAQRYARPGRIEVFTLASGNEAVIRVEDSGPGLPPNFDKRAFEPFTRADDSRSRLYGGSGLGLSIVRAIAEAHGGQASCRNSSRGGAVFEISLPRAT